MSRLRTLGPRVKRKTGDRNRITTASRRGRVNGDADAAGLWTPASIEKSQYEYNREVGRVNKLREGCIEKLFEQNDTRPLLANTAWGVYQAVCDRECFRDGPSSMYASVLFGERATTMARTLDHLAELK